MKIRLVLDAAYLALLMLAILGFAYLQLLSHSHDISSHGYLYEETYLVFYPLIMSFVPGALRLFYLSREKKARQVA